VLRWLMYASMTAVKPRHGSNTAVRNHGARIRAEETMAAAHRIPFATCSIEFMTALLCDCRDATASPGAASKKGRPIPGAPRELQPTAWIT